MSPLGGPSGPLGGPSGQLGGPRDPLGGPSGPRPALGLFLSHQAFPRIRAHFERLVRETEGLVDWVYTPDPGYLDLPDDPPPDHRARLMPERLAAARQRGKINEHLDVVVMPEVAAAPEPFVWTMEYDVDWTGHWGDFFARFREDQTDLISTTLRRRSQDPQWHHWKSAMIPGHVSEHHHHAAFMPIMRLSRRFARAYLEESRRPGWAGHFEFMIPTVASALGMSIRDVNDFATGGRPLYRPKKKKKSGDPRGTFVFRPIRTLGYVEAPTTFDEAGMLYHPVKFSADPVPPKPSGWRTMASFFRSGAKK
jgi:hypothetical protein